VRGLVQQGLVTVGGEPVTDAGLDVQPEGLHFTVQGKAWEYHAPAYVMLHKPAGTECSQKPSTWPSIYTLLPAPLRQRPQKGRCRACRPWAGWTRTPPACCC
jgi:16S rRNA pseudouridine516 synthase